MQSCLAADPGEVDCGPTYVAEVAFFFHSFFFPGEKCIHACTHGRPAPFDQQKVAGAPWHVCFSGHARSHSSAVALNRKASDSFIPLSPLFNPQRIDAQLNLHNGRPGLPQPQAHRLFTLIIFSPESLVWPPLLYLSSMVSIQKMRYTPIARLLPGKLKQRLTDNYMLHVCFNILQ